MYLFCRTITRDDLVEYISKHYSAPRMVLAAAGGKFSWYVLLVTIPPSKLLGIYSTNRFKGAKNQCCVPFCWICCSEKQTAYYSFLFNESAEDDLATILNEFFCATAILANNLIVHKLTKQKLNKTILVLSKIGVFSSRFILKQKLATLSIKTLSIYYHFNRPLSIY